MTVVGAIYLLKVKWYRSKMRKYFYYLFKHILGLRSKKYKRHLRQERYTNTPNIDLKALSELTPPKLIDNKYYEVDGNEINRLILSKNNWRYHHNLDLLKNSNNTYDVYNKRVDSMFNIIDSALLYLDINTLAGYSVCDFAGSEGYTVLYLKEKYKANNIDLYELNLEQIDRFHLIQTISGDNTKTFQLDLEQPIWFNLIPQKYDISFCLGIVYHMENPMLFLRNIYSVTNNICIIESDTPIQYGVNSSICQLVDCQVTLGSSDNVRYILESRPNIKALIDMLLCVGFKEVIECPIQDREESWYFSVGMKSVLIAIK